MLSSDIKAKLALRKFKRSLASCTTQTESSRGFQPRTPPPRPHFPNGETKALRGLESPCGSRFQSPERSSGVQGAEADPQGERIRTGAPPMGKALHWT